MQAFESLQAWRLRVPLIRPYKLSFGPVTHFDTLLVALQLPDGRHGWGEATLLTGYTDETIDGTWTLACELLQQARRRDLYGEMLPQLAESCPFLVTAFRTAQEMALGSALLTQEASRAVPILGLLQAEAPAGIAAAVEPLLAQGFRTLKVKVGFEPAGDAAMVAAAQRAVAGRAQLRLDANQGYSVAQALDFLSRIGPEHIELFEQPCAADDWAAHMAVLPAARQRGIALMLDESIYSEHDIERAATLQAARYIKVKLMKFGTLARLAQAIDRIRALGMQPVLGNGVANEPGCWMEACIAARSIDNAGEMNGFLKPALRLLRDPLRFSHGAIHLDPAQLPQLDMEAVAHCALAQARAPEEHPTHPTGPSMKSPSLRIRPASPAVGAEVTGLDLRRLSDQDFAAVRTAWLQHGALLFRDQHLSDAELIAFSRGFGELDPPPVNEAGKTFVPEHPEIYVVSNVIGADGMAIGSLGAGEAVWHTDMSYLPQPPDASMLYALEVPPVGGDTWFCSMEAALAALPQPLRRQLEGLQIKHDGTYNSGGYVRKGLAPTDDPVSSVGTPHPIVCAHPDTGRPVLYLGRRRNAYVVGLPLAESEALLDELWRRATEARHCWRHRWTVGDLVLWDNRSTMHRRDPFAAESRRIMHRTQIRGGARPRAWAAA